MINIFNKNENNKNNENENKLVTIQVTNRTKDILSMMSFDNSSNFSKVLDKLLELNKKTDLENELLTEISIDENTYLKLENLRLKLKFKTIDEVIDRLICY